MSNPILNQMMSGMFSNSPLINLFRSVKSSQNSGAMMQTMAQTNPQLGQVMNFINSNGGNAKQLFFDECKRRNVDPNIIINQLNNM